MTRVSFIRFWRTLIVFSGCATAWDLWWAIVKHDQYSWVLASVMAASFLALIYVVKRT